MGTEGLPRSGQGESYSSQKRIVLNKGRMAGQTSWSGPMLCRGSGWGELVLSRGGVPCSGPMTLQGLGTGSGQLWLPLQTPAAGQKEEATTRRTPKETLGGCTQGGRP